MGSALDSSLEDLIKARKEGGRGGRGRGRGQAGRGFPTRKRSEYGDLSTALGPIRRDFFPPIFRPSPYSIAKRDVDGPWKHDLYEAETSIGLHNGSTTGIEAGTEVFISNLDYGVSNEDIKELFSEVGDVKWSSVCYDRSGRSEGCAEVLYSRRVDAETAVKRYQDVLLDGKPMKVEIKGTNLSIPIDSREGPYAPSLFQGRERRIFRNMFQGFGLGGVAQSIEVPKTSEFCNLYKVSDKLGKERLEQKLRSDLDADLERYHAAAKTSS